MLLIYVCHFGREISWYYLIFGGSTVIICTCCYGNVGVIGIPRAYPGAPFTLQGLAVLDCRTVKISF